MVLAAADGAARAAAIGLGAWAARAVWASPRPGSSRVGPRRHWPTNARRSTGLPALAPAPAFVHQPHHMWSFESTKSIRQCLDLVEWRPCLRPHTPTTSITARHMYVQCTVRLTSRNPAAVAWLPEWRRLCSGRPPWCAPCVPSPRPRSPGWAAAASHDDAAGPSTRWACLQLPTPHCASSASCEQGDVIVDLSRWGVR